MRAEAAAAAKQRAIVGQLKEQLTNILLEVTDRMFGEWHVEGCRLGASCLVVLVVVDAS